MSKSKKLGVIKSIAILVIICLVTSGALAVVNSYTSPVIQAAAEERENQARQSVMPDATDFEQLDVKNLPDGVVSVYQGKVSSRCHCRLRLHRRGQGLRRHHLRHVRHRQRRHHLKLLHPGRLR